MKNNIFFLNKKPEGKNSRTYYIAFSELQNKIIVTDNSNWENIICGFYAENYSEAKKFAKQHCNF